MNYTDLPPITVSQDHFDLKEELAELKRKLDVSAVPPQLCENVNSQLDRFEFSLKYGASVSQLDTIAKYIEWISKVPWHKTTDEVLDINRARKVMDEHHYGLESTKEKILEYLSVLIMQKRTMAAGRTHAPVLFFVGLAGTGKTTFAKAIADALGREYARIPFGGLASVLDLRGLSKVTPEAEPGYIVKSLVSAASRNPVILLDELDRVAESVKGQVMGFLLELLDPAQNDHFIDHYIDYPIDLSQVIFVATANNSQTISPAVLDRMELIQLPSYDDEEKIVIARDYILPRLVRESGLSSNSLTIQDVVWKKMARMSGYDPGIRSIERRVQNMVRRAALNIVSGKGNSFTVTETNMMEFVE